MAALGGNIATTLGTPGSGWRELDIMPMIINQSPTDTPFFEMIGSTSVKSREHTWQTRTLKARGPVQQIEGSDFTYSAFSAPARVTNFTEIHLTGVEVSGSLREESLYGAKDPMRDQIQLRAVEHRNDWEWSLLRQASTLGDTDTAQKMDGLIAAAGNSTVAAGDTLTETKTLGMLETLWNNGSRPNKLLCGSKIKNSINNYVAGSTLWIHKTTRELTYPVLTIHSDYGTVELHLTRDFTSTADATNGAEMCVFDVDQLRKAWFRSVRLQPVAITGDYERVSMCGEMTFEYDNPDAIFYWAGKVVTA